MWDVRGPSRVSRDTYSLAYRRVATCILNITRITLAHVWPDSLSATDPKFDINEPDFAQPLSTVVQIALIDLLFYFGIVPSAVVGHSSGEIAAA